MSGGMSRLVAIALLLGTPPALGQTKAKTPAPAAPQPLARDQFIKGIDAEFRKTDADKNGQLTRTEIDQYQKVQALVQSAARNKALFAQLDSDKNGQLSPAEFAKLSTPAPTQGAQPMLSQMDGNRDGQVSLVEYRTVTLANFDRLDIDKDGVVSASEMKAGGISR